MSTPDSTPRPERPAGCPLFYHATGQWAKKHKGKTIYFGKDLTAALVAYDVWLKAPNRDRAAPEPDAEMMVKTVFNKYMNAVTRRVAAGELAPATVVAYQQRLDEAIRHLKGGTFVTDLRPLNFTACRQGMAKKWKSPNSLSAAIGTIVAAFKYCYESELIAVLPRFGRDSGSRPCERNGCTAPGVATAWPAVRRSSAFSPWLPNR
jgi:hypothetical protein